MTAAAIKNAASRSTRDEILSIYDDNVTELFPLTHDQRGDRIKQIAVNHGFETSRGYSVSNIGQIGFPPDTILDRSITIPMRRKKSSESCSPTPRDMKNFFAPLRMKLRRWASEHRDSIEFVNPSIPRSLRDRAADNWRPLLAIAETAGDDWPSRAAKAAETLSKLSRLNDESYGEMLLRDVGELFKTTGRDKLTTAEILLDLIGMDHRPWPEWKNGRPISDRQIALILQPFGISSKNIRLGAVQAKGYELSDFLDSFERYLS